MVCIQNNNLLVLLNLADASTLVTQSIGRIVAAQLLDERCCVSRNIAWKFDGVNALQDYVVRTHWVRSSKWRGTCKHTTFNIILAFKDIYYIKLLLPVSNSNMRTPSDQ